MAADTDDIRKMQEAVGQETKPIKEHEPLTDVLSHIPHKVQRGLSTQHETIELTALDANQYFIAVGSSIGIVFLYDREKHSMQKLRSENTNDSVSCVCLYHGLDDFVSIGYTSGVIYIFQLPSDQMGHSKKLERFIVSDIHNHSVRCLAWSTNGMRLFSGDTAGYVGSMEVDFCEGQCKSSVLLIESDTEIVQLDHGFRSLLVSTKRKCLVCRMDDKDRIVQIGSKDRKVAGDFGACFIPAMCKIDDAQLYASRPGFRIWKSSISGSVSNTYMYKELIAAEHPSIDLLHFEVTNIQSSASVNTSAQFGPVLLFRQGEIISWNNLCLYIINPDTLNVIGSQRQMGCIKCVAVTDSEIFILRTGTDRNLIRIAESPLKKPAHHMFSPATPAQLETKHQTQRKLSDPDNTSLTKDTKTTSEVSPFKMFQENFMDKVKHIPKPVSVIDKIQQKLHIDNKKSDGHVLANEGPASESRDRSPPGPLPPVIKLDSPDLLSIEIPVICDSRDIRPTDCSNSQQQTVKTENQVGPGNDNETNTSWNQSGFRRSGSGAFSALARLQEDHNAEECGQPIYACTQKNDDKLDAKNTDYSCSPSDTKYSDSRSTSRSDSAISEKEGMVKRESKDSFFSQDIEVEEGDIVFSRRAKTKHKKKKTGTATKDKFNKLPEKDQDSISVNSTTSAASSDTSVTAVKQLEESSEKFSEKSSEFIGENSSELSVIDNRATPTAHEEIDGSENLTDHISDPPHKNTTDKHEHKASDKTIDEHSDNTDSQASEQKGIHEGRTLATDNINRKSTSHSSQKSNENEAIKLQAKETNVPQSESNSSLASASEVKADSSASNSEKDTLSVDNALQQEAEESVKETEESSKLPTDVYTPDTRYPAKRYPLGEDNVSNLDVEMARLDSYLSQTSEATPSPNSADITSQSYMDYRTEADKILLRDTGRHTRGHGLVEERELEYEPSSLERELAELENTASVEEKEAASTLSQEQTEAPVSLDFHSSSNYSLYAAKGGSTSSEDFYSKYAPKSPSEVSSLPTDSMGSFPGSDDPEDDSHDPDPVSSGSSQAFPQFMKVVNTWTEISFHGNIYSLSVSTNHIWVTDRNMNIYYSSLAGPGLSWRKSSGNASQISVSRDGNIVWALHKGMVSAGTKITAKRPEGLKWVEAVRNVAYMCVDETCAWYVKTNDQVMMQKGLSRDRPCYTGVVVDCQHKLKQIVCRDGVVWALTDKCAWLYRSGITRECPEGTDWKSGDSGTENRLFSHLMLGEDRLGWAVDVVGQVWFRSAVTMETPRGDNHWWHVPLTNEYFVKDVTALDLLKSFSNKFDPQKLSVLLSKESGGFIAGNMGVWVCPESKHVLQVCRGSIAGQMWRDAHPESLAATSCWRLLDASASTHEDGFVWALQPNGDLFAFTSDRQTCVCIEAPIKANRQSTFVCVSACPDALWCLTNTGEVFIRTGMSPHEPRGSDWSLLDLAQLDRSHLVHISCANISVWSVDSDGNIFHRIGVKAPTDRSLNAAWLPVDNSGTVFTQIASCQQDWKVWAIDNRRQVYVRSGITQEMPIGRKWIHVSGTPAVYLTLSNNFVWAINQSGEILCRHGVTPDNISGDYWKKVPGTLAQISATPNDILWGINKNQQLVRRYTKYIVRSSNDPSDTQQTRRKRQETSISSEDGDWEFV